MAYSKSKANNIKWIIAFVLIAILAVGVIFALVKIDRNETTKTIDGSVFSYSIGLIDEEGEYEQGTSSIYMKDFYEVDGLTCKLDEKATISYEINFYDEKEEFISSTGSLETDFESSSIPETAKYFRVEITPKNDYEVSFFEINTYADQLTVTVNK